MKNDSKKVNLSPLEAVVKLSKDYHSLNDVEKELKKAIDVLKLLPKQYIHSDLRELTLELHKLQSRKEEIKADFYRWMLLLLATNQHKGECRCASRGFLSMSELKEGYLVLSSDTKDDLVKGRSTVLILSGEKSGNIVTISEDFTGLDKLPSLVSDKDNVMIIRKKLRIG
jgi:hypothetical protein